MPKVILSVTLTLTKVPDPIEFPEVKPGEDPVGGYARMVGGVVRGIVSGGITPLAVGAEPMLALKRAVGLAMSGDLADLSNVAARFDRLITEIEASSIAVPTPAAVEGPDGHSAE